MSPLAVARVIALATLAITVASYATAGLYLQSGQGSAEDLHGVAAITLHVSTGLLTAALAWNARSSGRGWGVTGLSAALFVFTFVQASTSDLLTAHVTGALAAVVVPAAIATWLFVTKPASTSAT